MSNNLYVVVLDDDTSISPILEAALGLKTISFLSSSEMLSKLESLHPLAVFLDVHLSPTEEGLELLPRLKQEWAHCPLIVMTSDHREEFLRRALEMGADDFVKKPLSALEISSRFKKRLSEKKSAEEKNVIQMGNSKLDKANRKFQGPSGTEFLSPTEVNILLTFIHLKGQLLSREELKKKGWPGIAVSDAAMEKKIFDLRKVLESVGCNRCIVTSYRKGYALKEKKAA